MFRTLTGFFFWEKLKLQQDTERREEGEFLFGKGRLQGSYGLQEGKM